MNIFSEMFIVHCSMFSGHLRHPDEGILWIRGQALRFRNAQLFPHDVRSSNQRHSLVERVTAAHSLASHTAVGAYRQALACNVFDGLASKARDLLWSFIL